MYALFLVSIATAEYSMVNAKRLKLLASDRCPLSLSGLVSYFYTLAKLLYKIRSWQKAKPVADSVMLWVI